MSFINGEYPIFFSGSWWHNRFTTEITGFDWGTFLFPEAGMSPGSAGNMWAIPERAQNRDLALEFIDITMRPEIQALIANLVTMGHLTRRQAGSHGRSQVRHRMPGNTFDSRLSM